MFKKKKRKKGCVETCHVKSRNNTCAESKESVQCKVKYMNKACGIIDASKAYT